MRSALIRYLPLVLLALAWEIAPRLGLVSPLVLPPLSAVLGAWVELIRDGELISNGASSLYPRRRGACRSPIVTGATLGVFMAWWRPVNVLLSPLVELFLSDAEISADPGDRAVARLRRQLQDFC